MLDPPFPVFLSTASRYARGATSYLSIFSYSYMKYVLYIFFKFRNLIAVAIASFTTVDQ